MAQLFNRTELTTPANDDFLHIVDASDTTDGVNGTSKKIRRDNLMTNFLTAFSHNSLASLTTGDPHTQYPFLTGRSGGQTLIGGTGTTDDLILRATSGVGTTGSFIDLQTGNNGANITRIDDTGNVGIGQTTPSSKFSGYKNLSVNANNGSTLSLESGGQPRFLFTADGTSSYISSYDDNPIIFSISTGNFANSTGTERMRIDANGNVGIGETAPTAQLQVEQTSTTADKPTLILQQADLSEEFIRFETTVGTGNAVNTSALGTYYGRLRININGTDYWLAVYNT